MTELTHNLQHSGLNASIATADSTYAKLLAETYQFGEVRGDRTGTGTRSIFGGSARFDCKDTVPLITAKQVFLRSCVAELVWFLIGSDNADLLNQLKSKIWDEWKLDKHHTVGRRLSVTEQQALLSGQLNTTLEQVQRLCNAEDQKSEFGYPEGTLKFLKKHGIKEFEDQIVHAKGYCGPMYGVQWNAVPKGFMMSKLDILLTGLKSRPFARDHMLVAWNDDVRPIYDNPVFGETNDEKIENNLKASRQPIPPCHFACQFYTHAHAVTGEPSRLSLQFHMRSADLFLGVPFNILSYGIFLHLVAAHLGLEADTVSVTFGDRHIYSNHIDQVNELLSRTPSDKQPSFKLSTDIPDIRAIMNIGHEKVDLLNEVIDQLVACVEGYEHLGPIRAPVAK